MGNRRVATGHERGDLGVAGEKRHAVVDDKRRATGDRSARAELRAQSPHRPRGGRRRSSSAGSAPTATRSRRRRRLAVPRSARTRIGPRVATDDEGERPRLVGLLQANIEVAALADDDASASPRDARRAKGGSARGSLASARAPRRQELGGRRRRPARERRASDLARQGFDDAGARGMADRRPADLTRLR